MDDSALLLSIKKELLPSLLPLGSHYFLFTISKDLRVASLPPRFFIHCAYESVFVSMLWGVGGVACCPVTLCSSLWLSSTQWSSVCAARVELWVADKSLCIHGGRVGRGMAMCKKSKRKEKDSVLLLPSVTFTSGCPLLINNPSSDTSLDNWHGYSAGALIVQPPPPCPAIVSLTRERVVIAGTSAGLDEL